MGDEMPPRAGLVALDRGEIDSPAEEATQGSRTLQTNDNSNFFLSASPLSPTPLYEQHAYPSSSHHGSPFTSMKRLPPGAVLEAGTESQQMKRQRKNAADGNEFGLDSSELTHADPLSGDSRLTERQWARDHAISNEATPHHTFPAEELHGEHPAGSYAAAANSSGIVPRSDQPSQSLQQLSYFFGGERLEGGLPNMMLPLSINSLPHQNQPVAPTATESIVLPYCTYFSNAGALGIAIQGAPMLKQLDGNGDIFSNNMASQESDARHQQQQQQQQPHYSFQPQLSTLTVMPRQDHITNQATSSVLLAQLAQQRGVGTVDPTAVELMSMFPSMMNGFMYSPQAFQGGPPQLGLSEFPLNSGALLNTAVRTSGTGVFANQSQLQFVQQQEGGFGAPSPAFTHSAPPFLADAGLSSNDGRHSRSSQHDLNSLLRHVNSASLPSSYDAYVSSMQRTVVGPQMVSGEQSQFNVSNGSDTSKDCNMTPDSKPHTLLPLPNLPSGETLGDLDLPPCADGPLKSWDQREYFPLSVPEDPNWLSEFHCFVRSEILEVFRAGRDDVRARSNVISYQQCGIRCRFCVTMAQGSRVGRSTAFPSSIRQIYQSFTMMLRDHFGSCSAMPANIQSKFLTLKDQPSQGATDSKRYWVYAAMKLGMIDTPSGIKITPESRASGKKSAPFGTNPGQEWEDDRFQSVPLVMPSDQGLISDFLYILMLQVQPVHLTESECIGNRRSLRVGLPGFGCIHCCRYRRLGQCRMFPARRRTLPGKLSDMYDHIRRCTVCPKNIQGQLETAKQASDDFHTDSGGNREFFDRVWSRLGHDSQFA